MLSTKARSRLSAGLLGLAVLAVPAVVVGSQVGSLVQFSSGEVIDAASFNSNFSALASAVNDTDAKVTALQAKVATLPTSAVGPQGSQGPQGVQGATGPAGPPSFDGSASLNPGGGTNAWATGAVLATVQGGPSATLSGRTYSATFLLQTTDATLGGDHAGLPFGTGALVLDLRWDFSADGGTTRVPVVQASAATLTVGAAGGPLTLTFSGVVPAAPLSPGGLKTTGVVGLVVLINAASTASGQSVSSISLTVP